LRNIGSKAAQGSGGFGFSHGRLGGGAIAAQIQQRRQHVLFDAAERGLGPDGNARRRSASQTFQLVFQLQHHALRRLFLPTPGCAPVAPPDPPRIASMRSPVARPDSTLMASVGSDAAHRDQLFEQRLFLRRQESEQRQRIFANVRVNAQRDFGAGFGKRGKSGNRNHNVVADAGGFDDDLIRMFPLFVPQRADGDNRQYHRLVSRVATGFRERPGAGGWFL
jgi:hypothetical protein